MSYDHNSQKCSLEIVESVILIHLENWTRMVDHPYSSWMSYSSASPEIILCRISNGNSQVMEVEEMDRKKKMKEDISKYEII